MALWTTHNNLHTKKNCHGLCNCTAMTRMARSYIYPTEIADTIYPNMSALLSGAERFSILRPALASAKGSRPRP